MVPSAVVVWNCVSRFVPALRQLRNWFRAVPCGATVLGFRVRSLVGSKSLSSHKRLEFHLFVLRVSQKPSRERDLTPVEFSGMCVSVDAGMPC